MLHLQITRTTGIKSEHWITASMIARTLNHFRKGSSLEFVQLDIESRSRLSVTKYHTYSIRKSNQGKDINQYPREKFLLVRTQQNSRAAPIRQSSESAE